MYQNGLTHVQKLANSKNRPNLSMDSAEKVHKNNTDYCMSKFLRQKYHSKNQNCFKEVTIPDGFDLYKILGTKKK